MDQYVSLQARNALLEQTDMPADRKERARKALRSEWLDAIKTDAPDLFPDPFDESQ